MKNYKFRYLTVILFIFFSSCQSVNPIPITITIYTNGKLAKSPTDLMPSNIKSFISPIDFTDTAYIPIVTIYRTDLPKISPLKIDIPKETANAIRSWFGTYDYNNLKDDYAEFLPNLLAGHYLSMESLIKSPDTIKYSSTDKVYHLKAKSNSDSVLTLIRMGLMTSKISNSQKIIIIINGDKVDSLSEVLATSIKEETKIADLILNDVDRTKALDSIFNKYSVKPNLDYWSLYELAKNRIEGSKHHEAFAYLTKAAELAISKKEGTFLLGRIKDDTEKDSKISDRFLRSTWRLTVGHPAQWNPIRRALKYNMLELLKKMPAPHEHTLHR